MKGIECSVFRPVEEYFKFLDNPTLAMSVIIETVEHRSEHLLADSYHGENLTIELYQSGHIDEIKISCIVVNDE